MGQYYRPCIISTIDSLTVVLAWLKASNFNTGSKQMEHSYIGNKMMQALELLISPEGPHHKAQVVWAGDYGGEEPGYDSNLYHLCEEKQCVKSIFQSQHV